MLQRSGCCLVASVLLARGASAQNQTTISERGGDADIEAALSADAAAASSSAGARQGGASAGATLPTTAAPSGASAGSLNPDLTIVGSFALAAFSERERYQTGGHDPVENGFNLQNLELAFGASVDPYLRFDGNLVFSLEGVEIEEAYATTLDLPSGLQARFGMFLTRFGRINSTHPHAWDFVDQPLALGRVFGPEGSRGLGLELSYLTPLPWYVELVGSVTPASGEGTARSFYDEEPLEVAGPRDLLYVAAIKQFFPLSDDWSLLWGLSGAFGPNASGNDNRSEVYATDLYLKYRPLGAAHSTLVTLQAEWLYRRRQVPEAVLADVSGYTQALYRFARRWSAAVRHEYGSAARDGAVSDPLDPEWNAGRTRWSANLTHYPTEFSRFRLQGSRDSAFGTPVWAAFLNAQVVIGAHGAHSF